MLILVPQQDHVHFFGDEEEAIEEEIEEEASEEEIEEEEMEEEVQKDRRSEHLIQKLCRTKREQLKEIKNKENKQSNPLPTKKQHNHNWEKINIQFNSSKSVFAQLHGRYI